MRLSGRKVRAPEKTRVIIAHRKKSVQSDVFVAIQTVFDIAAPNVSITGHLTGLAIGFLLGLLRARVTSR